MTRPYHSASSDSLARRCERAWYYQYVEGRRDPKVDWATIAHYVFDASRKVWADPRKLSATVKNRDRSTSLGSAMHQVGERWYDPSRGAPDWRGLPGQIFLSGTGLLPHPTRAHAVHVERAIGNTPIAYTGLKPDHAPAVGYVVGGIVWAGYRDLVVSAPGEFLRLGIDAPDGWALIDYKSTSDLGWALTPEALREDFAANLYADATCRELGIQELPARWVYFETKRRRIAAPRDAVIRAEEARAIVEAGSARARSLDTLEREQDAAPNPGACADYGGCPHHISAGGPCNARRSLGALIQRVLNRKKREDMALSPALQSKFASHKAAEGEAPPEPETTAEPTPAPAPKRVRPPKAKAPAEAPPPAAPAPSTESRFVYPAEHGPLVLAGDARDILSALNALTHGAS